MRLIQHCARRRRSVRAGRGQATLGAFTAFLPQLSPCHGSRYLSYICTNIRKIAKNREGACVALDRVRVAKWQLSTYRTRGQPAPRTPNRFRPFLDHSLLHNLSYGIRNKKSYVRAEHSRGLTHKTVSETVETVLKYLAPRVAGYAKTSGFFRTYQYAYGQFCRIDGPQYVKVTVKSTLSATCKPSSSALIGGTATRAWC